MHQRANLSRIVIGASLVLAYLAWEGPQRTMPYGIHYALWRSIPFAGIWVVTVGFAFYYCGKAALWTLLGLPLAVYWPIWLLLNGIPECYWHGNRV